MTDKPIFHTGKPQPGLVYAREGEVAELHAEIEHHRNDYSILKRDYDELRAEVERLRDHMRALADTSVNRDVAGIFSGLWRGSEKECDELRATNARLRALLEECRPYITGSTRWNAGLIASVDAALEPMP